MTADAWKLAPTALVGQFLSKDRPIGFFARQTSGEIPGLLPR
jgi:hypothetical protein